MNIKAIYEQRTLTAKFQCTKVTKENAVFEPIERHHIWPGKAGKAELMDITVNLNDESRKSIGDPQIADIREFTLDMMVMTRYEIRYDS